MFDPSTAAQTLGVIGLAELGDKSQLVCLALASRAPAGPVLAGAAAAFALLNTIAVGAGFAAAGLLPEVVLSGAAGLLFLALGFHTVWTAGSLEEAPDPPPVRRPFATTFALLVVAEMGDKTQLAVAGLASVEDPAAVWIGATLALVGTSAVAVAAGRSLGARVPVAWLHRAAGVAFLACGAWMLLPLAVS